MRVAAPLVLVLSLVGCGGAEPTEDASADDVSVDASGVRSCGGLKPAHCFCRLTIGDHTGNPGEALLTPSGVQDQALFTYVIPDKCYNTLVDDLEHERDQGCWRDCRDAFGVAGHARDPDMAQLIAGTRATLRSLGFCGGVVLAPSFFAVGTNRYKTDTGSPFSLGVGGTVHTVNGAQTCN